jgi:hypothetical protein
MQICELINREKTRPMREGARQRERERKREIKAATEDFRLACIAGVHMVAQPTISVEKLAFYVTLRPGAPCKHCNCTAMYSWIKTLQQPRSVETSGEFGLSVMTLARSEP